MKLLKDLVSRVMVITCAVVLFVMVGGGIGSAVEVSDVVTRSYRAQECNEITLITSNGSIDVATHAGHDVRVEVTRKAHSLSDGTARWLLEKVQVRTTMENGRVYVKALLPSFLFFFGGSGANITAFVPDNWQGTLRLDTSNGAINVANLSGYGEFNTSNGAILVAGWNGALEAKTSNGRIEADQLYVSGDSVFHTNNGSVTLGLSGLGADVNVRTSNGPIKVTAPIDLSADLSANTSNGNISVVGFGSDSRTVKNSYKAEINGGGPDIEAHSSNGSITIEASGSPRAPIVRM